MQSEDLGVEKPASEAVVVLDTNVLQDIYSCHDVFNMYEAVGEHGTDGPDAVYRRARARESLLLAMHFHNTRAVTYSLRGETLAKMLMNVDPSAEDDFRNHYVRMFIHFVHPRLLANWHAGMPSEPSDEPTGSRADAMLVIYAKEHDLPLITNEGYTPAGVRNEKMRKKAIAAGVPVFTPGEFYAGKIDEEAATRTFLRRFQRRAPRYAQKHSKPEIARDTLAAMEGYYRHVLLGETEGRTTPVAVSLSTTQRRPQS